MIDKSSNSRDTVVPREESRMTIAQRPIQAVARLRAKNQLTLPEPIAEALGAEPNDLLVFEFDPIRPGVALVHLVPAAFAGAMTGVYGTTDDVKAFIREEQAAWGE
jgi:bifunctional DNA-binding transcriptional regulator/antitoxin component of YhaV-PrlF toxin-antitoxin module